MSENFKGHRLKILVLFQGVVSCATQSWMEGNTTFLAKLLNLTDFFVFHASSIQLSLEPLSEEIKSLSESSNKTIPAMASP
jgi:hypothetical protein